MKKKIALAVVAASILFSASAFASDNILVPSPEGQQQLIPYGAVSKDGYFKGIRLAGKVKVVKVMMKDWAMVFVRVQNTTTRCRKILSILLHAQLRKRFLIYI